MLVSVMALLGCSTRESADFSVVEMTEALRNMAKHKESDELWQREYKRLTDAELKVVEEDSTVKIGHWHCDKKKGVFLGNFLDAQSKPWLSFSGRFVRKSDNKLTAEITGETHSKH
jgi:hypothetical protein